MDFPRISLNYTTLLTRLLNDNEIGRKNEDCGLTFEFCDNKMHEIFLRIAADPQKINEEVQRKDAFLAAADIQRPGKIYEIRQRRKALAQELARKPSG